MKTSFKKLTSVFLAVVMLFSVFAVTVSAADTGISSTGGGTIAFTDNQGWGDNIYAYFWGDNQVDLAGAWPGTKMGNPENNGFGQNNYSCSIPDGATYVVFSQNGGDQTVDITLGSYDGYYTDGTRTDGKLNAFGWNYDGGGGGDNPGGGWEDPGYNPGYGSNGSFKFTNNQNWGTVYAYFYGEFGDLTSAWPGDLATNFETNGFGETVYTINVPEYAVGCVINNGSGEQTTNITDFSVEGYYTDGTKDGEGHYNAIPWPGDIGGGDNPGGWDPGPGGGNGEYYLFGQINGEDNVGEGELNWNQPTPYAFTSVGGGTYTLSVSFSVDSYVAVKSGDFTKWYMTNGWLGMGVTSATLYETKVHGLDGVVDENGIGLANKLHIPAGSYTITIVDNGDESFNISYTSGGGNDDPGYNPGTPGNPGSGGGSVTGNFVAIIYCEASGTDDASRNSEHAFTNGTLTYDFPGDSYVFIRNYDTGVQYCTNGWSDFANPATLINEKNLTAVFDKMYVPAGTHTLYLYDNGDDTYQMSYDIPFTSDNPTEPEPTYSEPVQNPTQEQTQPTQEQTQPTQEPVPTSSEQVPTTPSTDDPVTDKLVVVTTLNKQFSTQNEVTDKTVTVTYNLTAPEKIADGQGTVTYDNTKLRLVSMELPKITSMLMKNEAASANTAKFNFTEIDPDTMQGAFDFTNGGAFVVLKFEVIGDAKGSASVDLTVEELDSVGTVYFEEGVSKVGSVLSSLASPSVTNGNASQQPTSSEQTPTTPQTPTTSQIPTDSTPTTSESQIPTDTEPQIPTETQTPQPTTEPSTPGTTTPTPTTPNQTTPAPTTPAPTTPAPKPTNPPSSKPNATQPVKPATNLGKGASGAAVQAAILAMKNDSDPKGSTFNLLQVKNTKTTKNSIKLSYKKPSGTKSFEIYAAKCGSGYKKVKSIKAKTFTYKGLKKNTYYKFLVVALDKNGKVVATSKTIHVATKGGKNGNPSKVTITNASSAQKLAKGKSVTLKTKVTAPKSVKVKNHRKVKFESSNTKILKVTNKGKVTAKKKGTATIYAYAQNGVMAKVKIKVS